MAQELLPLKSPEACQWDAISLGEVLLRFDPGMDRIAETQSFRVWEGGGEYNVARALHRSFRHRTSVVTALVDNPVGRLLENLVQRGGLGTGHILWRGFDGVGQETRNGVYFLESGFGVRGALGCMDRGHTAVSQLAPGQIDWDGIFGEEGVRWFHTGGIFAALSAGTLEVTREAVQAAKRHGTVVSYDCNYRPSLWKARGGRAAAAAANRGLAPYIDVLFGHEGDLQLELTDASHGPPLHTAESYQAMAERLLAEHPNLKLIVTPTRRATTASRNDWGGFAYAGGAVYAAEPMLDLEVLDRVGSGDAFAAGVIHGMLTGAEVAWALRCGVAAGALTMTTLGDSCVASLSEIEHLMRNAGAGVQR